MKPISTVVLKWLTAGFLLTAFVLMLSSPRFIRRPARMDKRAYVARLATLGGALGLFAVGAGVGAFVIMRREQAYFREKAMENLHTLIEATRKDALKKPSAASPPKRSNADTSDADADRA